MIHITKLKECLEGIQKVLFVNEIKMAASRITIYLVVCTDGTQTTPKGCLKNS